MEELNNSIQTGTSEKVQGIDSVEGTVTAGSELGTGTVDKPGEGIELQPGGGAAAIERRFLSKTGLGHFWNIIKGAFISNGKGITVSTDSKGVSDVYINGNDVTVKCAGSDGAEGNDGSISILANTGSYAKGSANKTIEILSADTAVIGTYDNDSGEVASNVTFGKSTINIDSTEISVHTSGNGRFDIVEASTGSAYFQCSPNYTSVKGREFYVSRTGSQRAVVVTMNNDDDSTATIKLRGSATNNVTVTPDLNKIVGDTEFKDGVISVSREIDGVVVDDKYIHNNIGRFIKVSNPGFLLLFKRPKIQMITDCCAIIRVTSLINNTKSLNVYQGDNFLQTVQKTGNAATDCYCDVELTVPISVLLGTTDVSFEKYRFVYNEDPDMSPVSVDLALYGITNKKLSVRALRGSIKSSDKVRIYRYIRTKKFNSYPEGIVIDNESGIVYHTKGWAAPKIDAGKWYDLTLSQQSQTCGWEVDGLLDTLFDNFVSCDKNNVLRMTHGCRSKAIAPWSYKEDGRRRGRQASVRYGLALVRDGKVISNIAPFKFTYANPYHVPNNNGGNQQVWELLTGKDDSLKKCLFLSGA